MKTRRVLPLLTALALLLVVAPTARADLTVTWHAGTTATLAAIAAGPDGSLVVVGTRTPSPSTSVAVIQRRSSRGELLWSRTWPSVRYPHSVASSVDVSSSGRIYVAGVLSKPTRGLQRWFVLVYRPDGGLRHVRKGPRNLIDNLIAIGGIRARGNRVVLAGTNEGCCEAFVEQGWVQAFRPDLTRVWSVGLGDWHPATGLALGAGGAAYISGWRVARFAPGPIAVPAAITLTLTRLDADGDVRWTRAPHLRIAESGASVAVRGNRVMVVATHHGAPWLGRFTTGGTLRWSKALGIRTPVGPRPMGLAIDGSGSTWVVGLRRDRTDHREDSFVRRIGAGGEPLGVLSIEDVWATDVTAHGPGVAVSAETGLWQVAT